jgi:hypothetical protein
MLSNFYNSYQNPLDNPNNNLQWLRLQERIYTTGSANKNLVFMNEIRERLGFRALGVDEADFIAKESNEIPGDYSLWVNTYTDYIDDNKVILNTECSICLRDFTETSLICSPNVCQHGFHCKCIRQAMDKKCPNCRVPFNYLVISSYNLKPGNGFGRVSSVSGDIRYLRGLRC